MGSDIIALFKGGHEIGVARQDDDRANHLPKRQMGHLHADPHIDTLLAQVQVKVGISQLSGLLHQLGRNRRLQSPFLG
jgi:hypothetical protein